MSGITTIQHQLERASVAVAQLNDMGCGVLAVLVRQSAPRAAITIANADPLCSLLDAQRAGVLSLSTEASPHWHEGEADFLECRVHWFIERPKSAPAPAEATS